MSFERGPEVAIQNKRKKRRRRGSPEEERRNRWHSARQKLFQKCQKCGGANQLYGAWYARYVDGAWQCKPCFLGKQ